MRRFWLVSGIALALSACCEPLAPGEPWQPQEHLWQETTECAGLTLPLRLVLPDWFIVEGDSILYRGSKGQLDWAWALHSPFDNQVLILRRWISDGVRGPSIIRHEMLHELLFEKLGIISGHPEEYFSRKCGHLVYPPREFDPPIFTTSLSEGTP